MSFESLKKLSELFNSELQETKLHLIERKESILDKFNLDKLNLQKELNQIEESLEFFENENEILVKALMLKEKDFANTQYLFEYEKKNLHECNKEKLEMVMTSKENIKGFIEQNKGVFEDFDKEKSKKIALLEEKIKALDEEIKVYQENLGLSIEVIEKNRFSIGFQFIEKPGIFTLELIISPESEFRVVSITPKLEISQELIELNLTKRFSLFLNKIREKFLKV